jgi:hypothetical protein
MELRWDASRLSIPASGPLHSSTIFTSVDKMCRGAGPSFDFRQAIMQLQFLCQRTCGESRNNIGQTSWLRDSVDDALGKEAAITQSHVSLRAAKSAAERRSFCDANLNRPFDRACEVSVLSCTIGALPCQQLTPLSLRLQILEPDGYASTHDDVVVQGTVLLFKPRVRLEAIVQPIVGREHEYREALLGRSDQVASTLEEEGLDVKRLQESSRVDVMLRSLFVNPSSRMPCWEGVVDYAPMIGNMIQADDEEEAAHNGRLTSILQEARDHHHQNGWESEGASSLLETMGIRPSRHSTRLLLERGSNGLLALGKREADFQRWICLDREIYEAARQRRLQ